MLCISCEQMCISYVAKDNNKQSTTYRFSGGRTGQGDDDSSGDELHGSSSSRVFEIVVAM